MAPTALYEIYRIFPINNQLASKGTQFVNDESVIAERGKDGEVNALLRR